MVLVKDEEFTGSELDRDSQEVGVKEDVEHDNVNVGQATLETEGDMVNIEE